MEDYREKYEEAVSEIQEIKNKIKLYKDNIEDPDFTYRDAIRRLAFLRNRKRYFHKKVKKVIEE